MFKRPSNETPAVETPDDNAETAQARAAALAAADALAGDEAGAVVFIGQCEFADARLRAAQHVQSKPFLEQVDQAMRNADRRVAKLMQQRLDEIERQDTAARKATDSIVEAQRLAAEPHLLVNQVADLDRAWQDVGEIPEDLKARFAESRHRLSERLEAQTALQRAVMDAVAGLEQLRQEAAGASVSSNPAANFPASAATTTDPVDSENSVDSEAPAKPEGKAYTADAADAPDAAKSENSAESAVSENSTDSTGSADSANSTDSSHTAATATSANQEDSGNPENSSKAADASVSAVSAAGAGTTPESLEHRLDRLEQAMAEYAAAPEAPSLPRHLLADFVRQHRSVREALGHMSQRQAVAAGQESVLSRWETTFASRPNALDPTLMRREWQSLPSLEGRDAPVLQERFEALLAKVEAARRVRQEQAQDKKRDMRRVYDEAVAALEHSLQEGALHNAAEQDKALRALDLKTLRLSDADNARLTKVRAELNSLQGWAKWGGHISREELLKAAQDLPEQQLGVAELAKKVGGLRERWKALDTSSGPAGKDLWKRFDAACTAAYAPAAAHFKKLSEERHINLARAQALVAELKAFTDTTLAAAGIAIPDTVRENKSRKSDQASKDEQTDHTGDTTKEEGVAAPESMAAAAESAPVTSQAVPSEVDWKAVASFRARLEQLWHRLGPIDRKERKIVDQQFRAEMQRLAGPLSQRQEEEKARREKMIEQAAALDATDRRSLDTLRGLQERWQERARALPLERGDEQQLWKRFRAACDAVFTKRKEATKGADAERRQHLKDKQALCATLEAGAATDPAPEAIAGMLRDAREVWHSIGPVPRAAEREIDSRYQAAIATLNKKAEQAQRAATAARINALRDKLRLCQEAEQRIAAGATDETSASRLQQSWEALPKLANDFEATLGNRFETALAADAAYAATLEKNKPAMMRDILRLEIQLGLESPAELARERLRLQVEVLQSSLKAGQKPLSQQAQLLALCALPALADEQERVRIERLLSRLKVTSA